MAASALVAVPAALPRLTSMASSTLLLAGLGAIFLGLLLALATTGVLTAERQAVARSLAAVQALQAAPRALREKELERPFAERVLGPALGALNSLGRRLTPVERYQRIKRRLDLAGNPPDWDADRIVGLKVICALLGGAASAALLLGVDAAFLTTVSLSAAATVLGWLTPSMILYQAAYNRSDRMRRELPDSLDLLTISVEAGLAFDAALSQVARKTQGPLADEFARVLQEMQIGTGRVDALRGLSERTDVAELRAFVGAMVQADAFGIPIADVLRVQAGEMRVKRSQRAEEAAQKVPVKMIFPLIFCVMPALFIVVIGPAAIGIMHSFVRP